MKLFWNKKKVEENKIKNLYSSEYFDCEKSKSMKELNDLIKSADIMSNLSAYGLFILTICLAVLVFLGTAVAIHREFF